MKAHPNSASEFELKMGPVEGIKLGGDKLVFKQEEWQKLSFSKRR